MSYNIIEMLPYTHLYLCEFMTCNYFENISLQLFVSHMTLYSTVLFIQNV